MDANLGKLPIIQSTKGLSPGDAVYSRKHGLGSVHSLYRENEIIICFSENRVRISVDERDISIIPKHMTKKQSAKVEIEYGGKRVTQKEYKRLRKNQKKQEKIAEILNQEKTIFVPKDKDVKRKLVNESKKQNKKQLDFF